MAIPETKPSPNEISELGTVEEWRQITNQIVRRLNSLYNGLESSADLNVGGSIYSGDLASVQSSYILVNGESEDLGKIKTSDIKLSELQSLLNPSGSSIGSTLSVGGDLNVDGKLNVDGDFDLDGCLNINGCQWTPPVASDLTTLLSIRAQGDITINGTYYGDGSGLTGITQPSVWVTSSTNNNDIYYGAGNVGIGGEASSSKNLHVKSNSEDSNCNVTIESISDETKPILEFKNLSNTSYLDLNLNEFRMFDSSNIFLSCKLTGSNTGNLHLVGDTVKILKTSKVVEVTGDITATGTITSSSDLILKENLEIIENPIEKVKKINGYTFNKKGETPRLVGLVAQEVDEVLPEAVSENQDGIKSLAYGNMVALLVETVKEQQKQIDELRQMIQK